MLDDVVVHVHKDPDTKQHFVFICVTERLGLILLISRSPFFTFLVHFGYPVAGNAVLVWYLWMTNDNRLSFEANMFLFFISLLHINRKAPLTASIRPLSVGDFSIRASNTSSVSFRTYNSTTEKENKSSSIVSFSIKWRQRCWTDLMQTHKTKNQINWSENNHYFIVQHMYI